MEEVKYWNKFVTLRWATFDSCLHLAVFKFYELITRDLCSRLHQTESTGKKNEIERKGAATKLTESNVHSLNLLVSLLR